MSSKDEGKQTVNSQPKGRYVPPGRRGGGESSGGGRDNNNRGGGGGTTCVYICVCMHVCVCMCVCVSVYRVFILTHSFTHSLL
jgi:hypothetical protein